MPGLCSNVGRMRMRTGGQDAHNRCSMLQCTLCSTCQQLALKGCCQAAAQHDRRCGVQHLCCIYARALPCRRLPMLCSHDLCCGGKAAAQQHTDNGLLQGRVASNGSSMLAPHSIDQHVVDQGGIVVRQALACFCRQVDDKFAWLKAIFSVIGCENQCKRLPPVLTLTTLACQRECSRQCCQPRQQG